MEEPMSTTLTIPADVLADVRVALFCLMGDATQGIDQALVHPDRERHPEWFADHRRQLGRVFATLDLVGWAEGDDSRDVEIDVRDHGQTLKEALNGYLPLLEDQEAEADINDTRRAEEGKRPRKQEIIRQLAELREFMAVVEQRLAEALLD
jgi:BMFP domain-containing protein YqiC